MRPSSVLFTCAYFGLSMAATHPAPGQVTGVSTQIKDPAFPDDSGMTCSGVYDIEVCNVYVDFAGSNPFGGLNYLLEVGFVDVVASAGFFQIPAAQLGMDLAPSEIFFPAFPQLVCDSFVTINLKSVPSGVVNATANFIDSDLFNNEGHLTGGWFDSNPPGNQGQPDPVTHQVLVAQLAYPSGTYIAGGFTVFYFDGTLSFEGTFACGEPCLTDLNIDNHTNAADLALLLGGWGENPGHIADLNGDGFVDASDLAIMLGNWGECT